MKSEAKGIIRHFPNFLTCMNLLCGCLGIVCAFGGELKIGIYFVLLGAIFDFSDGFAARLLNAKSLIGKDLDSLADMVSFGVFPAVVMYHLMLNAAQSLGTNFLEIGWWAAIFAFLIAIMSGVRLAKFNNDTRQSDKFIGLPTPANTIFVAGLVFLIELGGFATEILTNYWILAVITALFSWLLVCEVELLALKFKHFKWHGNELRYIFLLLSVSILIIFGFGGLSLVIGLYILISLFQKKDKK